jgi:cytochrome c biogenesis protein CcmG/thiol:disulfide interchange protein DsbE
MKRGTLSRKGIGTVTLVLALVVALAGAFLLYRVLQPGPEAGKDGAEMAAFLSGSRIAPPFSLEDTNGNIYSSAQFAGKPAVINFFATWCPPCREEIPGFVEVYNRHKANGLELIGISLDTDTRENLPGFLMNNKIGYRILFGDLATTRAYGGVSVLPTTFFVGKDGKIKNVHVGYMDEETFDKEVRDLVRERGRKDVLPPPPGPASAGQVSPR